VDKTKTKRDGNMADESALHSSIKTKGQTSYYYAHASTAPPEQRYTAGDHAPILIQTGISEGGPKKPHLETITTYSWADDGAKILVYIPLPSVEGISKEALELTHTKKSLKLVIPFPTASASAVGGGGSATTGSSGGGGGASATPSSAASTSSKAYCFLLPDLHADIEGVQAVVGIKNSRIVLHLKKAVSASWYRLLASDRPYDGDE
jgi:hypothetical protein